MVCVRRSQNVKKRLHTTTRRSADQKKKKSAPALFSLERSPVHILPKGDFFWYLNCLKKLLVIVLQRYR